MRMRRRWHFYARDSCLLLRGVEVFETADRESFPQGLTAEC